MSETRPGAPAEYVAETQTRLDVVEACLMLFRSDSADRAALSAACRRLHTAKSEAALMGAARFSTVAAAGLTLLERLRDGTLQPNREALTLAAMTIERLRVLTDYVARTGAEPTGDDIPLLAALHAAAAGQPADFEIPQIAKPPRAPHPAARQTGTRGSDGE